MDIDGPVGFEDWHRREHPRLVTVLAASTGDSLLARMPPTKLSPVRSSGGNASRRWRRPRWTYKVGLNVARRGARRRALERRLLGRVRAEDVPGPTGELWLLAAVMGIARGTLSSTLRSAHERLGAVIDQADASLKEAGLG